jgi:hypothetical protein
VWLGEQAVVFVRSGNGLGHDPTGLIHQEEKKD